jgi:hypothetical protein
LISSFSWTDKAITFSEISVTLRDKPLIRKERKPSNMSWKDTCIAFVASLLIRQWGMWRSFVSVMGLYYRAKTTNVKSPWLSLVNAKWDGIEDAIKIPLVYFCIFKSLDGFSLDMMEHSPYLWVKNLISGILICHCPLNRNCTYQTQLLCIASLLRRNKYHMQ